MTEGARGREVELCVTLYERKPRDNCWRFHFLYDNHVGWEEERVSWTFFNGWVRWSSQDSKHLHLSCFKVFQMFYNSRNRFDSNTELIQDINKAIYMPLELKLHTSKLLKPQLPHHVRPKIKAILTMNTTHFHRTHKPGANTTFIMPLISPEILREGNGKMSISPKPKLCFIWICWL